MGKRGELILKERPILRFKAGFDCDSQIYREQFEKLLPSLLDEILQLYKCPKSDGKDQFDRFTEIMNEYGSQLSGNGPCDPPEIGLFQDRSMLNNSCIPNAETNFVDPYMRVYAIQDIAKDEEICIEYVDMRIHNVPPTINLVKEILRSRWGFDCICELCGNLDEKRREEIENHRISYWLLYKNSEKNKSFDTIQEAGMTIKFHEDLLQQMSKAKRFSVRDRMEYAFTGLLTIKGNSKWYRSKPNDRKRKAKYFYQVAEEALLICEGNDGPSTFNKLLLPSLRKALC